MLSTVSTVFVASELLTGETVETVYGTRSRGSPG